MSGAGSTLFIAFAGGAFGLVIGSWLTAVAHRLPRRMDLISDRSRCPHCDTQILARDNIPVFGWLLLRGRCRSCAVTIPARYPLIELLVGAAGVALALWNWPAAVMLALLALLAPVLVSLSYRNSKSGGTAP